MQSSSPLWCLESTALEDNRVKWRLLAEFKTEVAGIPDVIECSENRFRFASADGRAPSWSAKIPDSAGPLPKDAKVRVSRRLQQLTIEWCCESSPSYTEFSSCCKEGEADGAEPESIWHRQPRVQACEKENQPATQNYQSQPRDACPSTSSGALPPPRTSQSENINHGPEEVSQKSPRCYMCGVTGAKCCCTNCRVVWYCSRQCQRRHWVLAHRTSCDLNRRILGVSRQRRRGDCELALATVEQILKDVVSAIKSETEKEFTCDKVVIWALMRSFSAAVCAAAAVLTYEDMPEDKFCRAACRAIACLLDMSAALKQRKRLPNEIKFHIESLTDGMRTYLQKDADPVLSAWMLYDGYARGLEDRPSSYSGKLVKVRAAALVGLHGAMSCAHDLCVESPADVDKRVASRIDKLFERGPLRFSPDDFQQLRPFCPERRSGRDSSDSD